MTDNQYDILISGTGVVECILSGLLSQEGKKVLHIDRNPYYGGMAPTLNFNQLWQQFKCDSPIPQFGVKNRNLWSVDLIPKFILSNGRLVKLLQKLKATRYLEFKVIDTTLISQQKQGGCFLKGGTKLEKVPVTKDEILHSNLMGLFEKRRYLQFIDFSKTLNIADSATYNKLVLKEMTFLEVANKFGLEMDTVELIGHIFGFYNNESFFHKPALEVIKRIQVYFTSQGVFNYNAFIYPIYGFGEISQGIARLLAIYGSTLMLDRGISEFLLDNNGKFTGITMTQENQSNQQTIQCDTIITDPTYIANTKLSKKVKSVGFIIRCFCIISHPLTNFNSIQSALIVLPASQIGRKSDINITLLNSSFQVCEQDYFLCSISTNVETQYPESELEPAFELLNPILEKFINVSIQYLQQITEEFISINNNQNDNIFITNSICSSVSSEEDLEQIFDIYKRIMGKDLDLTNITGDEDFS